MRRPFAGLLPFALLLACGRSPYAGYKDAGHGAHLRLHKLGDGEALATDSDSVLLRVRVAPRGDAPGSLLSTERWYAARDLRSGALVPVLRRMHEGDSMSVIARQERWPWPVLSAGKVKAAADTALLQAELALLRIKTPKQWRAEALRMADPEGYEQWAIARHVQQNGHEWARWGTSAMRYAVSGAPADTARVAPGDMVTVGWTGKRLADGSIFDEQSAFTWRYGDPDQVIGGIQAAVSLLRPGQRGVFVLPSAMAYGERGIPGVLPPWSPVVYEVRLLAVERKDRPLSGR